MCEVERFFIPYLESNAVDSIFSTYSESFHFNVDGLLGVLGSEWPPVSFGEHGLESVGFRRRGMANQ